VGGIQQISIQSVCQFGRGQELFIKAQMFFGKVVDEFKNESLKQLNVNKSSF
jgi:hypothetical protein